MHSYFTTSWNSENRSNLSESVGTGLPNHSFHREKSDPVVGIPDLVGDPMLEPKCTIELSIPRVVALTSDSSAYVHSKDDPNTPIVKRAIPSELEEPDPNISELEVSNDNEFLDKPSAKRKKAAKEKRRMNDEPVNVGSKKWKKKYDLTKKYQVEWAAKAPWSEGILKDDGLLHVIKCTICSLWGARHASWHRSEIHSITIA